MFFYIFFSYILKCPKVYQLNIIKNIKQDFKKNCEIYQNLSKEEKKSDNMDVTKISQRL